MKELKVFVWVLVIHLILYFALKVICFQILTCSWILDSVILIADFDILHSDKLISHLKIYLYVLSDSNYFCFGLFGDCS